MPILDYFWHRKYRDDLKSTVSMKSKREVTSCDSFARTRAPNNSRKWVRFNSFKNALKTVNFVECFVLVPPVFQNRFVLFYKIKMIWVVSLVYNTLSLQSLWKHVCFYCHLLSSFVIPTPYSLYRLYIITSWTCPLFICAISCGPMKFFIRHTPYFLFDKTITHYMMISSSCIS